MGIEADTASPWTPAKVLCAISCHQIDPVGLRPADAADADGRVEPYLAESIEPNADYTVWTIKAREGVTFHDGTPLDGAAIARQPHPPRSSRSSPATVLTDVARTPTAPRSSSRPTP